MVMGWRPRVGYALDPLMTMFYASPLVALAPLVVIFFGVGVTGKAILIFLLAIFPFIFNTAAGVRSVEIGSVMFGENARHELLRLAIPRRVYTQSHIDYLVEAILEVNERKEALGGFEIARRALNQELETRTAQLYRRDDDLALAVRVRTERGSAP